MGISFTNERNPSSNLYQNFVNESFKQRGGEIVYFPLWDYEVEDTDIIWGEDGNPRYAKGMIIHAVYEIPDKERTYELRGVELNTEVDVFISADEFRNQFPDPSKQTDYDGPKEGDWFRTRYGQDKYFEVTDVVAGDWTYGDMHSYKLTCVPRRYSFEEMNANDGHYVATSLETTATTSGEKVDTGLKDVIDMNDDIEEESDEVVQTEEEDKGYWSGW